MTPSERESGTKYEITIVQVEEKATHVLVVYFSTSVRLILRDDFTTILADELIFLS